MLPVYIVMLSMTSVVCIMFSGTFCSLQAALIPTSFPRSLEFAMRLPSIWKPGVSQWTANTRLASPLSSKYPWWHLLYSRLTASCRRMNIFDDLISHNKYACTIDQELADAAA